MLQQSVRTATATVEEARGAGYGQPRASITHQGLRAAPALPGKPTRTAWEELVCVPGSEGFPSNAHVCNLGGKPPQRHHSLKRCSQAVPHRNLVLHQIHAALLAVESQQSARLCVFNQI